MAGVRLRMLREHWKSSVRLLALPAAIGMAALIGACTDTTQSFSLDGPSQPLRSERTAGKGADLEPLAAAHKANPGNAAEAIAYAKALRTAGAKTDAMVVLETAAGAKPNDRQLTLERGLLALDLGDTASAETLLRAAHDPKAPDWRLHSALGAALASRGKQPEAQAQFAKALALSPDHPSILNNLALSYALDGKAAEAEKLLRKAAAAKDATDGSRTQQNLALVLGLGGKFAEARTVAEAALPAAKASQNVTYLQKLAEARATAGANPASVPGAKEAAADLPQPVYRLGAQ
jgi:Flp pilus assembly protein TadD